MLITLLIIFIAFILCLGMINRDTERAILAVEEDNKQGTKSIINISVLFIHLIINISLLVSFIYIAYLIWK